MFYKEFKPGQTIFVSWCDNSDHKIYSRKDVVKKCVGLTHIITEGGWSVRTDCCYEMLEELERRESRYGTYRGYNEIGGGHQCSGSFSAV
nr:MAG TPA: hypothetical protein [Caudoviricetes sp.]